MKPQRTPDVDDDEWTIALPTRSYKPLLLVSLFARSFFWLDGCLQLADMHHLVILPLVFELASNTLQI